MPNPTERASRSPAAPEQASTLLGLVVFLLELLLLAVLAIAGVRLGNDTVTSILLAVGLTLAAALLWGLLLAPRATRRLRKPLRLVAKLALVALAATLLGATGVAVWSIAFGVVAAGVFAIGELIHHDQ